jgi:sulfatase modifying factor 1
VNGHSHPVCSKEPNALGLCDMSGNVWEWTWDHYGSEYYSRLVAKHDPIGPLNGNRRVLRGGSWSLPERHSRVYARSGLLPRASGGSISEKDGGPMLLEHGTVGFRLVRSTR